MAAVNGVRQPARVGIELMRALAWVLLLAAAVAEAGTGLQGGGLAGGGTGMTAGANVTATSGNMSLFVDPAGNDSNACTATGFAACLTIGQAGALGKVPKYIRNLVTINVAAGNYAGFFITGFTFDFETPSAAAGLLMVAAAPANVTPTTGSATGTLSSVTSIGTGPGLNTVTDSTAAWTVDDFKGKLFVGTSGTGNGTIRTIVSNTATVITLAAGGTNSYAAATGYAIQTQSVVVTTGTNAAPIPTAGGGLAPGIWIGSNVWARSNNSAAIQLQKFRVNISTTPALQAYAGADATFVDCAFETSAANGSAVAFNDAASTSAALFSDVYAYASTAGSNLATVNVGNSSGGTPEVGFSNSYIRAAGATFTTGVALNGKSRFIVNSGRVVIDSPNNTTATYGAVNIRDSAEFLGPVAQNAAASVFGNAASPCVNMQLGITSGLLFGNGPSVFSSGRGLQLVNCSSGIITNNGDALVSIEQTFEMNTMTTAFEIKQGARLRFLASSGANTFTAVTNELLIDGAASSYAAMEALSPPTILSSNYGTLVMRAP